MHNRIALVYNEPTDSRYDTLGENSAVVGVLHAVKAVHRALRELGYHVTRVPLTPPPELAVKKLADIDADLVFNLFEGFCGSPETEALVPDTMAARGIPCTGCPGKALKLALDKARVKEILKASGMMTPDYQLLNPHILHTFNLGYPCIVKPRCEDASHGMSPESLVNGPAALAKQVREVCERYGDDALVEVFVDGNEYNATVLGNSLHTVLPVSEIVYTLPPGMPEILTFAAKWENESIYFQNTRTICPAPVDSGLRERISGTALSAYRLAGCKGYARVDMRMDREGQVNVIEVNPNPDISPGSGALHQAAAAGMPYTQFIGKIVQLALEENKK
jgi:D-alanine-D-alanine ligase